MKMTIEYEVTQGNDELVGVFNWRELKEFLGNVKDTTIKSAYMRGSLLLGIYRVAQVKYDLDAED